MAESVALSKTESTAAQPAASSTPASATNTTNVAASNASRQSWVADGWKAVITRADGTVESVPNFSELFPGQADSSGKPAPPEYRDRARLFRGGADGSDGHGGGGL